MMKKNYKWIFLGIGIVVGVIVLFLLLSRLGAIAPNRLSNDKVVIKNEQTGEEITFHRDGLVEYKNGNQEYSTVWSSDKMRTFFEYLESGEALSGEGYLLQFSNGSGGNISSDDELIDTIIDEVTGGGGGETGGGGGPIGGLFNTPNPSGSSSSSGSTPQPPAGPSWCKHWKLSYCADGFFKDPTPTPNSQGVIIAKDCQEWRDQATGKTVISGDSCSVYSPTPVPQ